MTDYTIPMIIGMALAFTLGAGFGGLWGLSRHEWLYCRVTAHLTWRMREAMKSLGIEEWQIDKALEYMGLVVIPPHIPMPDELTRINKLKGIMKRDKIEKKVNDVLNDVLGIDYSEIKDDAVLEDDFGADSIDAVEIVMGLEHEFGISIPEEKMYGNESCTVKNVYDLVEELL